MEAYGKQALSPEAKLENIAEQIGSEEVASLFRVVRVAVISAAIAAVVLAAILVQFRSLPFWIGTTWAVFIASFAAGHVCLKRSYDRSLSRTADWRFWGNAFTAISFGEGVGWGWASVMLAKHDTLDAKFLVLLTTQSIAAGSVPAFGRYLPAFLAIFFPTTIPYAVSSLIAGDGLENATGVLMIVYICGMAALAISANRQFHEVIRLRLQTDSLVDELRKQKEIAEEANRAKSSFLAAASHDLRQPVHALGLFVGALRSMSMPPAALHLVEQIDLSSQAMDSLFAALLDISRLDAGVVEVHERVFPIDSVLSRICTDYRVEATAKSLILSDCRSSAHVASDPILIERVFRNLVSNAVRYTETGRVLIGCRHRPGLLVVQVWDTGPGIPLEQQERIFQEYYQLGNSERDRAKGLGLGLAIVRRLTHLLGVPIRVKSMPNRGSCFEIDLPIAQPPPLALTGQSAIHGLAPLESRLIVVIDDEASIRAAMFSVLTGWGHNVVVAGSGEEAIRMMSNHPLRPDLIICDLRLRAGELGTNVIEMLRTEYNEAIPAILVTGDTAPDRLADAKSSGLLLLHKPVSNGRLRAALINVISHASVGSDP